MNVITESEWLQTKLQRLAVEGFVRLEQDGKAEVGIEAIARRTRFEISKFGFSETFFIFRRFDSLNAQALRDFSSNAFRLAKLSKTIPLPCGVFESVWCFAVAVADQVDGTAAESVRNVAPPMHWAAAEIPVIFNQADRRLYYFEKTPLWGAAYYSGFRSQIKRFLDS
ncbi:MAG: hypothetical protein R3E01_28035 [Pirellulaceae bacterium]